MQLQDARTCSIWLVSALSQCAMQAQPQYSPIPCALRRTLSRQPPHRTNTHFAIVAPTPSTSSSTQALPTLFKWSCHSQQYELDTMQSTSTAALQPSSQLASHQAPTPTCAKHWYFVEEDERVWEKLGIATARGTHGDVYQAVWDWRAGAEEHMRTASSYLWVSEVVEQGRDES